MSFPVQDPGQVLLPRGGRPGPSAFTSVYLGAGGPWPTASACAPRQVVGRLSLRRAFGRIALVTDAQKRRLFSAGRLPRLGILGASRIVDLAIMGQAGGLFDVFSLAARDYLRAHHFASSRSIRRAYGSYEELCADPEVDVVYNALPCSEHMPYSELALANDKHVLCEKPFALDAGSAERALALAEERGLLLMEAHHWRYHCLVPVCEQQLSRVGVLRRIEARFVAGLNHPSDIRKNPTLGAGVTLDFGCYLVQWARFVATWGGCAGPPKVIKATMLQEAEDIDVVCDALLDFGGVEAHLFCDMRDDTPFEAYVRGVGDRAVLEFRNPLGVDGSRVRLLAEGRETSWSDVSRTTYRGQLEAFAAALRTGDPVFTMGRDTLETQRTLDAIYAAAGLRSRLELARRFKDLAPFAQRGEFRSKKGRID